MDSAGSNLAQTMTSISELDRMSIQLRYCAAARQVQIWLRIRRDPDLHLFCSCAYIGTLILLPPPGEARSAIPNTKER